MSLILDALNRSRRDVGEVPGLDSQHQVAEAVAPRSNRWWMAALLLALAVIAFLLYERSDTSVPVAEAPRPAEGASAPARPVAQEPARPVIAPTAAQRPAAEKVPVKQQPVTKAQDAEVVALYNDKPAREAPAKQAAPEPAPEAPEKQAAPEPTPAPEATASEQPVDIEAMIRQAQDELENSRLDEHPAPLLSSLSQQSKDRIPTILYERHDYSGKPGQSSVVLNGKTLKAGGRTSGGVRVDEILPDSVVLTFQGTQFRLRALNSWVNL